jgi:hypothetical protein
MHLPLIVTLVIALPLDQVLQAVVPHSAVQYSLDLIHFLTVDKSWGWGWCRSSARDGIRMCDGQLDHPFPYFPSLLLLSPCSYVLYLLTSVPSPGITLKGR